MIYPANIEHDALAHLPRASFEGYITVVETSEEVNQAIIYLLTCSVLGFDTETKPCFSRGVRHKVALLQLSSGDKAFLFKLNETQLPHNLVALLTNPDIIKVGVAIRDDIKALQKIYPFVPAGFIDLQHIVSTFGIKDMGVKKIAGIVLQVQISKSQQLSNWENKILSDAQQKYAATDAWICQQIYKKLYPNT